MFNFYLIVSFQGIRIFHIYTKDIAFYLWFCLAFCQQVMTLCLVFSTLLCKQTFLLTRVIYFC